MGQGFVDKVQAALVGMGRSGPAGGLPAQRLHPATNEDYAPSSGRHDLDLLE
ncbi:hypothetical protein FLP41_01695 (plasmid) [Paracoccus marcusii]|uniref:hypothetical protein n=1 Tax=Paracoccus marcusii TaxID=59779 RepID=UPI002ED35C84|nr:hypothetical protein FLP41_01695 [Paracoccus marcusii]